MWRAIAVAGAKRELGARSAPEQPLSNQDRGVDALGWKGTANSVIGRRAEALRPPARLASYLPSVRIRNDLTVTARARILLFLRVGVRSFIGFFSPLRLQEVLNYDQVY